MSFLEVYLDNVRDLLIETEDKIDNIISKNNNIKLEKCSMFEVKSFKEMLPYLDIAAENRVVAETKCNEYSSRSHR